MLDGLTLVLAQVFHSVLERLEVLHILQQGPGVHQILVNVVEVREHDVSPENELVQGLCLRIEVFIDGIQFQEETQFVGDFHVVKAVEEIIDGIERRYGKGHSAALFLHQGGQVFLEENQGAAVGKKEACLCYVRAGIIVRGHLLEKWYHISR